MVGRSRKKSPSSTKLLEENRAEQMAEDEDAEIETNMMGGWSKQKEVQEGEKLEQNEPTAADIDMLADPWALIGGADEEEERVGYIRYGYIR